MGRILAKLKRLRIRSLYRGDYAVEGERSVENTDAGASMLNPNPFAPGPAQFPPDYVKTDDARPRH